MSFREAHFLTVPNAELSSVSSLSESPFGSLSNSKVTEPTESVLGSDSGVSETPTPFTASVTDGTDVSTVRQYHDQSVNASQSKMGNSAMDICPSGLYHSSSLPPFHTSPSRPGRAPLRTIDLPPHLPCFKGTGESTSVVIERSRFLPSGQENVTRSASFTEPSKREFAAASDSASANPFLASRSDFGRSTLGEVSHSIQSTVPPLNQSMKAKPASLTFSDAIPLVEGTPHMGARWPKWLEREFTGRNVRGSNPASAPRLFLSRLGKPGSTPALMLSSDGMAARHQMASQPNLSVGHLRVNGKPYWILGEIGRGGSSVGHGCSRDCHSFASYISVPGARWTKWLESEFTDRKVRGSNPTSATRLPLSRPGRPVSIPALRTRQNNHQRCTRSINAQNQVENSCTALRIYSVSSYNFLEFLTRSGCAIGNRHLANTGSRLDAGPASVPNSGPTSSGPGFSAVAAPKDVRYSGIRRWLKWLERKFTDRKVCVTNRISTSRLPLSRLAQSGNIPALVLSSGSMAVYSALDSDQNLWALKDVNLRGASKELADSYLNEVDMLLTLRDTGRVIRLHDHEQTPTNLYLILELASVDLKDVFMELFEVTDSLPDDCPMAKLSPLAVAFYWDQMLRCVKVLHDKRIVHLDLKPQNFVLVRGKLKLIDLGVSQRLPDDCTRVNPALQLGTLTYMSPEQLDIPTPSSSCRSSCNPNMAAEERFRIGRKSDIWALGVMLYLMVYSRSPFPQPTMQGRLLAIINPAVAIEFPPIENQGIYKALQRSLVRDYKDRASVEELLSIKYGS
ncbi:hypothetical protein T265_07722 [Opisthorchis viverrini]|uniref:Protein kinase domain-containing protein n=1 Tax=Opisthorchis viverrini TaxID=6198 RepID=A0A074ZGB2_OPIVI|nr:hypothetical protein T265_07722 [Opisthorchis viverrini]KER24677.1 hypothetical protein T265_07722 [Opisthorchis viverrini]